MPRPRVQVRPAQRDHQRLRVGRLDLAMRDPQQPRVVRRAAVLHPVLELAEQRLVPDLVCRDPAGEPARDAADEQCPVAEREVPGPARVVDVGEPDVRAQGGALPDREVVEDRQHLDRRSRRAAARQLASEPRVRVDAGGQPRPEVAADPARPALHELGPDLAPARPQVALARPRQGVARLRDAVPSPTGRRSRRARVRDGGRPASRSRPASRPAGPTGRPASRRRLPRTRSVGRAAACAGASPASPPHPCDRPARCRRMSPC